jgi:zinc protease
MLIRKLFQPVLLFLLIVGNQYETALAQNGERLPLNPKLTTGKLSNGITYFIQPNAKPEQKVELRLVVNSGSVSEDDDQLGLAHMCEHMAFNGTKNFKKNDIVSFLQDIGVGFGSDLNAYTSFDRTVYILPIPTDKPGNLEKGFQVLEDWAHQVSYNTDDINGERQIILEESRLGKGAEDRMQQKTLKPYFNGSRFGMRLPIGEDSIIRNFKPDVIRRYYKDWYRPELMAVIVVGDITPEKGLQMIQRHFGGITTVTNPRTLPPFDFPSYTQDKAMVVTDKEATGFNVDINWPAYAAGSLQTMSDYRNSLIESIFNVMLNARFREIIQKPNPPFLFASGSFSGFVRGYDQFSLSAGTGTNDPAKAVKVLINEIERVKQFGYIPAELERAKKNVFSNYESAFKNKEKTESGNFVEEYINYFLDNEAAPGIDNEFDYVKKLLPGIALAEVNQLADRLKGDKKKFTSITGPEKTNGFQLPSNEELVAMVNTAASEKLTAYEEKTVSAELLKKMPVAGKIVSRKTDKITGTTELLLSNGINVILKPTDFKDDEILLQASRFGGQSNYGLTDLFNARYAGPIQGAMGYGEFTPSDLQKILSGKKVSAGGSIAETRDIYSGSSTVKDLETMFQLLYLKITNPRLDTALFSSFLKKQQSATAMAMSNPQTAFIDTLGKALYNNNPLAPIAIPKPSDFDHIDLQRAQQIFKERLCDPTGMTFVIVGSFKEVLMLPFIEKYIASLPVTGKKTAFTDRKVRPGKGNRSLSFNKGKEQKSLVVQVFSGEIPYTEDLDLKAQALTEALNIRIIEEIREKRQAIYGGGIQGGLTREPYNNYQLLAFLPTGPEKVDTVLQGLKEEIKKMQDNGPAKEILDKVKKQWLEANREDLKNNNAWAVKLMSARMEKQNIDRFINFEKYVNKLTPADIKDAAKKLLNSANMFTAVQLPEATPEKAPENLNNRTTKIAATYEIAAEEITIEVVDNATVDGDQISLFFNGKEIASKQDLTDKPLIYKVRAVKGNNTIVMQAENLGTIPPNTAYMIVKCNGKTYKAELSSDLKESGAIRLVWK